MASKLATSKHPYLLAFGGYLLLAVGFTWPLLLHLDSVAGRGGDAYQNLWNIWWVREALFSGQSFYHSNLILYPEGTSLYLHTLTPYNGIISAPLQLLLPLPVVYNLLCLLAVSLAGLGMYLLAADLCGQGGLIPFFAGAVYALSPYEFAHLSIGHLNLISIEWLPFYLWALLRAISLPPGSPFASLRQPGLELRWVLAAAICLILTALCDWQYAFYLALISGPLVVWQAVRQRRWWVLFNAAAVAALAGVVLAPIVRGLLGESGSGEFIAPPVEQTKQFSADLAAFFLPGPLHPLWGADSDWWDSHFTAGFGESPTYLGYLPLLLAGVAVMLCWRRAWFWAVTAAVALFVSLGPQLHVAGEVKADLPYFLNQIPALSMYRMPVRFVVVVMLCLAVLAAIGLAHSLAGRSLRLRRTVAAVALLILLVEYLPTPFPFASAQQPAFYSQIAADGGGYAVIELPINLAQGRYVYAQTVHQKPLVGGYLARFKHYRTIEDVPGFRELYYLDAVPPDIFASPAMAQLAALRYWGVRYLIVHPAKFSGARAAALQVALAALAEPTVRYQDEQITVYTVKAGVTLPFLSLGDGWGGSFGGLREGDGSAPLQRSFSGTASLQVRWLAGGSYSLSLDAQSIDRGPNQQATLRVELDSRPVGEFVLGDQVQTVRVPLALVGAQGAGELRLFVSSGSLVVSRVAVSAPH